MNRVRMVRELVCCGSHRELYKLMPQSPDEGIEYYSVCVVCGSRCHLSVNTARYIENYSVPGAQIQAY